MSHRFQKLQKRHVSTFFEILYRTVAFLNVFGKENFHNFHKPARHDSSSRQHFHKNIVKIKNPTQVMMTQKVSTKLIIEKCLKTASSFCNVFLKSRYKAMMFILMLCIPISLHFVRFLHFFVGPEDIYEKVGGCKFGFISVLKPEKYWSTAIIGITGIHYTFGLIVFWKIVKIRREYVNQVAEI